MTQFLHAADIHLDSPLRGLARYQGAPVEELQGATRRALTNLVNESISREVDLLLISGDLYDGDWPDYNTGLFFSQEMARLERASIPVVLISGNHDAQNRITRNLRLPSNVQTLSAQQPETIVFEELGIVVHGQSFAQQAVTEDLSQSYPAPVPGQFNIGMLHTSADGRPGHDTYAPCSVESLKKFGYQYWALGHIHQREVLSESPWIVFCGNLQGRHVKEAGPKGATLVTLEKGEIAKIEALTLDVVRWAHLKLDISQLQTEDEFLSEVQSLLAEAKEEAEGRLLAYRLETVGRGPLHNGLASDLEGWTNQIRGLSSQLSTNIWFEKLKLRSQIPAARTHDEEEFPDFLDGLRNRAEDEKRLLSLAQELYGNLYKKLPRSWRVGEQAFEVDNPDYLKSMAEDAVGLIEERVSSFEGGDR